MMLAAMRSLAASVMAVKEGPLMPLASNSVRMAGVRFCLN